MDSVSVWLHILDALQLPPGCSLLDLAPSGDDSLPVALARRDPAAHITPLDISSLLSRPSDRLRPETFHLVALRHAIDDIAQAIVAEHEGMNFTASDEQNRSALTRALRAYCRAGDFERIVVPQFIEIVEACRVALRPKGCLLLSHEVLDSDLRLGQPLEIYADYVPLARRWIAEANLPLREISLDGFEPHWWLLLQPTA